MIRLVAVSALLVSAGFARADILVEVLPSVGPNPFSSPSSGGYDTNAIAGIRTGGTATGDAGSPTGYSSIPNGGTVSIADLLATDFPYWRGTVNPTGAFAGETGNLLNFGARITSDTGMFALSNVTYTVTDTFDGTLDTTGGLEGESYSNRRVGVIYNGADPPTILTSGSGNQLVDELWLVGLGVGYELLAEEFVNGIPAQDQLPGLLSEFTAFQITTTYTVRTSEGGFTGSATVNVDPNLPDPPPAVPAPPGLILVGVGLAAVGIRRQVVR